ncbi:ParB/Srx family N-terminal domain-containing protein [Pseudomonas aeruginosa]|nr:ParB/Srx family N-terminal domain-containing protein [Pseudomonas aeruginosa]
MATLGGFCFWDFHFEHAQRRVPQGRGADSYARNPRTHAEGQIAKIAASIVEYGWTNPILVDGDNGIIAGHGRLAAARKLELDQVPVIELAHLSVAQKRALVIADNRLALDAGWDEEMLALELADLSEAGYDLR